VEVTIAALRSPQELAEIAEDAGAQMGRGAPRSLPGAAEDSVRAAIAKALDQHETRIRREVQAFADATTVAWKRFQGPPHP
jgi:phage baseplate assembly protein W